MQIIEQIKSSLSLYSGFAVFVLMVLLAMIALESRDKARHAQDKESDNLSENSSKKRWPTILVGVIVLLLIPIIDIIRGRDIVVVSKAWALTVVIACVLLFAIKRLFSVTRRKL